MIDTLKQKISDFLIPSIFYLLRKFSIKRNKIMFFNFNGLGFGDNPKAIALQIHNLYPDADIIWFVHHNYLNMPSWIRQVEPGYWLKPWTWRFFYEIVTAKIWVSNARLSYNYRKRNGQFYAMVWHGSLGVKKVENDIVDKNTREFMHRLSQNDSDMCDLMISDSKWLTEVIQRAFWYRGEIINIGGTPRVDALINYKGEIHPVHDYYNLNKNEHLIIYAPTFREDNSDVYDIDFELLITSLKEKFGIDYKVIVRMHPRVQKNHFHFIFNDMILNGSPYPDMYELLAECDILITDYSSTMFDMSYAKKAVWIYANDIEKYDKERGFYFDIRKLPFPLAENNEKLRQLILNFNQEEYLLKVNNFLNLHEVQEDGRSSERLAKRLIKEMNK